MIASALGLLSLCGVLNLVITPHPRSSNHRPNTVKFLYSRVKEIKDQFQDASPEGEDFEVVVNMAHTIAAAYNHRQRVAYCKMFADFLRLALLRVQEGVAALAERRPSDERRVAVCGAYKDACRVSQSFDFQTSFDPLPKAVKL